MVQSSTKNVWTSLEIDSVFSEQGLMGIEECSDYDLSEILASKKKRRGRKRKQDIAEPNDNIPQPAEDVIPQVSNQRKKKKKNVENAAVNENMPSKCGSTFDENSAENLDMAGWNLVDLPNPLLKALQEINFYQPTEIQSLTLPAAILGKRDILGAAETGSGKTLAFGLPILAGIMKLKENSDNDQITVHKPLYSLILTPTRELAVQIKNHLVKVAKYCGINVAVVVGGMAAVKQERVLSKGPEIVVATPGRLWELFQQGNPHLSQMEDIRFLAIDETDRMIEKGHFQELHLILERLNMFEEKRKLRQNFVFSATLTLIHEIPRHVITKKKLHIKRRVADMTPAQKLSRIIEILGITDPKVVDITKGKGTSGTLTESRITCSIDEKDYYVYYFLQKHPGRTLIFCNSIGCVKRLTTLLSLLQCSPMPLHASMQQRQRLKNLDRFRDDDKGILIATDVAARGLDIPAVEHVIHYQTPRTSESYVHRSGRTARAASEGITVLLVEPSELPNYLRLCRTLEKTEDIPLFPVQENYLNAVKTRVNLARELDKLELHVKKSSSEVGWIQKAAEDMDMIIDDVSFNYDMKESKGMRKASEVKRKQLAALLQKPVFPKGFSSTYPLSSNPADLDLLRGEQQPERAVTVMKNVLQNQQRAIGKKKPKSLFKPKIRKSEETLTAKSLMRTRNGKKGSTKKLKKRRK